MVHQVKFGIADRMKGSGADSLRNCENADLTEKKTNIIHSHLKRRTLRGQTLAGLPIGHEGGFGHGSSLKSPNMPPDQALLKGSLIFPQRHVRRWDGYVVKM